MILGECLRIAAFGFAAGLPLAAAVGHLLRSQLYGLSSSDPVSVGAAVTITLVVAVGATLIPARQASRVDPIIAIRSE